MKVLKALFLGMLILTSENKFLVSCREIEHFSIVSIIALSQIVLNCSFKVKQRILQVIHLRQSRVVER